MDDRSGLERRRRRKRYRVGVGRAGIPRVGVGVFLDERNGRDVEVGPDGLLLLRADRVGRAVEGDLTESGWRMAEGAENAEEEKKGESGKKERFLAAIASPPGGNFKWKVGIFHLFLRVLRASARG
jgi:hypothetical protein